MTLKNKALLFNFIGFAVLFLVARFALAYFLELHRLLLALLSAVIATVLAPKFAVVHAEGRRLVMKWIFLKGVKEL